MSAKTVAVVSRDVWEPAWGTRTDNNPCGRLLGPLETNGMHTFGSPCFRRSGVDVRGFTAIELMVTVAILAVLTALAAPSFTSLLDKWRVRSAAEALQSTLYFARSEAIKRGGGIAMAKLGNTAGGCQNAGTTQEWGCGWIVFVDANDSGTFNSSTELKLRDTGLDGAVNVMRYPSGNFVKVDRYGMANGNNTLRFVLSPSATGVSSPAVTTLCMGAGGRIRILSGEVNCT